MLARALGRPNINSILIRSIRSSIYDGISIISMRMSMRIIVSCHIGIHIGIGIRIHIHIGISDSVGAVASLVLDILTTIRLQLSVEKNVSICKGLELLDLVSICHHAASVSNSDSAHASNTGMALICRRALHAHSGQPR